MFSIITFLLKRYWEKEKCCGFLECNPINLIFPYFHRSYEVTSSYLLSWLNFTFCLVWYEKVYWETIKKLELLRLIKLQYIYTFDLSVCLWWKKNIKTDWTIETKFFVTTHTTSWMLMYKKVKINSLKNVEFFLILEIHQCLQRNPQHFKFCN